MDGVEKEVPVEGATILAAYDSNLIQKYIKTATNYENRGFNAEQLQYYTKVLSEYGLNTYNDRNTYVWNPQGSQDLYLDRWYNGNGYGWKAPWSGGFGPRNQIPFWVHIETQHLMFYIVESTRSNASDCAELVFWY